MVHCCTAALSSSFSWRIHTHAHTEGHLQPLMHRAAFHQEHVCKFSSNHHVCSSTYTLLLSIGLVENTSVKKSWVCVIVFLLFSMVLVHFFERLQRSKLLSGRFTVEMKNAAPISVTFELAIKSQWWGYTTQMSPLPQPTKKKASLQKRLQLSSSKQRKKTLQWTRNVIAALPHSFKVLFPTVCFH